MSAIDILKADLKEVHHYPLLWTQAKAVNTLDEAIDIVLQYDDQITAAANRYSVPKEMVQAIVLREQATLGLDDTVADSLVMNYYTKGFGQPDSSTGIGQIFARTAIAAENAILKNITLDTKNPKDIWTVWQNLQDPTYNIEHVAMILKMEAKDIKS